jgi:recA bacterial DNA recombination protein
MPTFQSIGVHPALRSRLVTQSSVIAAASSASADAAPYNDSALNSSTTSTKQSSISGASSSSSSSSVETPLALLACHPESLRLLDPASGKCHAIDKEQVTELRQQVAEAIIADTRDGLHVGRVRGGLRLVADSSDCGGRADLSSSSAGVEDGAGRSSAAKRRKRSTSNVENEHRSNAMEASNDADDFQVPSNEMDALSTKEDSHLFGTLTSLELLTYESMLRGQHQVSSHPPEVVSLSTGCRQLDLLLSFPVEYGGIVAAVSRSLCEEVGGHEQQPQQGTDCCGWGGVPRGYVTQLYGPPASGKTQVALHVAAHRFRASRAANSSNLHPASSSADAERRAVRLPCWLLVPPASQVSCAERISTLSGNDPAVMSQTYFHPVSDIYQVLSALVSVEESLLSASAPENRGSSTEGAGAPGLAPPALIVLDSASTCSCCPDPNSDESQRLTSQLAKLLKRIARQHLAAVLVTNGSIRATTPTSGLQSVGSAPPETKRTTMLPALGRIWERAVDIQVKVEEEEARVSSPPNASSQVRTATVTRHPAKPVSDSGATSSAAFFTIDSTLGIRDATGAR